MCRRDWQESCCGDLACGKKPGPKLAVDMERLAGWQSGSAPCPGPFVSPKMCGSHGGPEVCSTAEQRPVPVYSSFNEMMSSWSPEVPGMN